MLNKINKRRVRAGASRLNWDRQLGYVARKHAKKMARERHDLSRRQPRVQGHPLAHPRAERRYGRALQGALQSLLAFVSAPAQHHGPLEVRRRRLGETQWTDFRAAGLRAQAEPWERLHLSLKRKSLVSSRPRLSNSIG